MNTLIISDLHLTERKQDEYRWLVFDHARNFILKNQIPNLYILGDLLDKKDRHPAELVNRLVAEINACTNYSNVFILKGNHDYLKPDNPFLEFIKHLQGVTWIDKPGRNGTTLWLPHSRNPEVEWENLDFQDLEYIFMHQSVIGSQVSNMFEMNHGLNLNWLTSRTDAKIYSGDIHVPQKIGPLTYVGTQHPVAFGDDYQPRMLWLEDNTEKSIPITSIKRLVLKINSTKDLERMKINKSLEKGDQIKVKVLLGNKELSQWTEIKQVVKEWCSYNEITLFDVSLERLEDVSLETGKKVLQKFVSIDPQKAFKNFTQTEKLDPFLVKIGQDLLNAALQDKGV